MLEGFLPLTSQTSWGFPPYKTPAFLALGIDLDSFRLSSEYQYAVEKGWIVNDEWVGPSNPKG